MAKDKNKSFEDKSIEELEREVNRRKKEKAAKCSHQNKKGEFIIYPLGENIFECENCGDRFSMEKIGNGELRAAINTLHNAINQVRIMSNLNKEKDVAISRVLGVLNFDIKEVQEFYERIVRKKGKDKNKRDRRKHKHNNQNNDGFGGYSYGGSLSFIRSGKGNGNKKKKQSQHRYF